MARQKWALGVSPVWEVWPQMHCQDCEGCARPIISATWESEAEGLKVQGQTRLSKSEFKDSQGNLVRFCLINKTKSKRLGDEA